MAQVALRTSAVGLIFGTMLTATGIVFATTGEQPLPLAASLSLFVGSLLLMLALPGMYARQATKAGWLGLVGHVLLEAGLVLVLVFGVAPLMYPTASKLGESVTAFLLGITLMLGFLLTAIAMVRAHVYPRGAGVLLLAAGGGFFFSFIVAELLPRIAGQVGGAIFGALLVAAFTWMGVSLWQSHVLAGSLQHIA